MRDVAEQAPLAGNQPFQAFRHLVERPAYLADLVFPIGLNAYGEVATTEERNAMGDLANGRDDAGGGDPAKNSRCADDKEVVGKKRPDARRPLLALRREPEFSVLRAMRDFPVSTPDGARFGR